MSDEPKRETTRTFNRGDAWDRFIDELDRRGQAGSAADVVLPDLSADLPTGTRFGDLTKTDIENLSRYASSLGRRSDTIRTLWTDLRRKPGPVRRKRRT
jgi:hypothetical protein